MPRKFDKQRLFNRVVRHLFKQGGRAMNGQACMYRTMPEDPTNPACRACGIGGIIPNSRYSPDLENEGAGTRSVIAAIGFRYDDLDRGQIVFLREMQSELHDRLIIRSIEEGESDALYMKKLPSAVENFARLYNLKVPEVART